MTEVTIARLVVACILTALCCSLAVRSWLLSKEHRYAALQFAAKAKNSPGNQVTWMELIHHSTWQIRHRGFVKGLLVGAALIWATFYFAQTYFPY